MESEEEGQYKVRNLKKKYRLINLSYLDAMYGWEMKKIANATETSKESRGKSSTESILYFKQKKKYTWKFKNFMILMI